VPLAESRQAALALVAAVALATEACGDSTAPAPPLPLKNVASLAAQLDTIVAGVSTPQLKSMSAMALPMLAMSFDIYHMDSTFLGKTVEWNPVQQNVYLTTRAGTPSNVLQVTLYAIDNSGLPSPTKTEIGYAYLEPLSAFNGGRADSTMMRFTLFTMTRSAVADWNVWRLPADTACGQCATISAALSPTAPGGRFINLTIPYSVPLHGDGAFNGTSFGAGFGFSHAATLPGPASSAATAGWAFSWQGDSIRTASGALFPSAGELVGETDVRINSQYFAAVTRTASRVVAFGPQGQPITSAEDLRVLGNLFAVPADIADNIEWPTFVIFFCGC